MEHFEEPIFEMYAAEDDSILAQFDKDFKEYCLKVGKAKSLKIGWDIEMNGREFMKCAENYQYIVWLAEIQNGKYIIKDRIRNEGD